jgi:hypothetical protein
MADTSCEVKNIDIVRETNAAVQIRTKTGYELWIPFSQVHKLTRSPTAGMSSVCMETWIAKKKGLI